MVKSVGGSTGSAPINPASNHTDLHASMAKNFVKSIVSASKGLTGGGGFKLTIAATGAHKSIK
jgi:hypothetical protein